MENRISIGVTGVGGGVGQSIIKSLYDSPYSVIGMDGEALGTGAFAVPHSYRIPYARSEKFIDSLLEICKEENCRLLFPGLDAELKPLSEAKQAFADIGTQVIVSSLDVVEISDNKLATYEKLSPLGISVPVTLNLKSYADNPVEVQFPLILKQQVGGARSKNVYIIKTREELKAFLENNMSILQNYVLQEYIDGDEYTCGTINWDGECRGVIVMRRILRDGDTYKCFVEFNPRIEEEVRKVVSAIKPFGACNVQLRMKNGQPYIFEINARCSGTTAARTLCGFNEPRMIADYLLHGIPPAYAIKELSVLRYWNELVVDNNLVKTFMDAGELSQTDKYSRLWK